MRSLYAIASVFLVFQCYSAKAEICKHDASVTERFLPVDLITGTEWNKEETITYPSVDRTYPWTYSYRNDEDNVVFNATTSLKGPVEWQSPATGKSYQVYDRVVVNSRGSVNERMTVIEDKSALGRLTDDRLAQRDGEFENEGKYPVGKWKQGEKRSFNRLIHFPGKTVDTTTTIEIEKLSCVFEGIPNSVQIRWADSSKDLSYIFAPGRGLAHVMGDPR